MKKCRCIMVVDNEPTVLRLLIRTLEPEGYDVIAADNVSLALDLLDEHSPDLIILEMMMPGLGDLQVLELIREHSTVPVIILSVKDKEATKRDALVLGADDYVCKPFHTGELLARIRAKLRRAG